MALFGSEWSIVVLVAASSFFPLGALVLRKRLEDAEGGMLVFKIVLYAAAAITLPFAIYFAGLVAITVAIDLIDSAYRLFSGM